MGVRTKINIDEVNDLIKNTGLQFCSLEETIDGISDSTYITSTDNGNKYILKIYEFASKEEVKNEINILNALKELPTPKSLLNKTRIPEFQGKPIGIFTYLDGKSQNSLTIEQIKEIGLFLGKFHNFSQHIKSINKNIYSQESIKILIDKICSSLDIEGSIKDLFLAKYELVKHLSLEENCVIHGDLFPDNAKFLGDKLTGVFDFVEACNGHCFFDLAVVINSWCFDKCALNDGYILNKDKFDSIIEEYNKNTPKKATQREMRMYMMYASLFYAAQRFNTKYIEKRPVNVKDYNEYLIKFKVIMSEKVKNCCGKEIMCFEEIISKCRILKMYGDKKALVKTVHLDDKGHYQYYFIDCNHVPCKCYFLDIKNKVLHPELILLPKNLKSVIESDTDVKNTATIGKNKKKTNSLGR